MRCIISIVLGCFALLISAMPPAMAETQGRYASIVVDADSLEIIHARQIDELRYPASLTKVMTLFLVFDAINRGELRLDEKLIVSSNAARTPPVGLGLTRGQAITVDQAIQAVAVRSANDVAVVLAERLAGSEELFAVKMNAKARELGMQKTIFKTASGLPHPEQKTSARDMAKMSMAILNHHRRYYHYLGQKEFTWKGYTKKNTNALLHWLAGVDGFKTGFTRASGYNLIISAQRDGRRIIAVVLGGASGKSRNTHMKDLVEKGFKTLGVNPVESHPPVTVKTLPAPQKETPVMAVASAVQLRGRSGEIVTLKHGVDDIKLPKNRNSWSVQLGAFGTVKTAEAQIASLLQTGGPEFRDAQKSVSALDRFGRTIHRARLTGLTSRNAHVICQKYANLASGCLVIAPGG